jgi:hypothetical protein
MSTLTRTTAVTPYLAALRLVAAKYATLGDRVCDSTAIGMLSLLYGVSGDDVYSDLRWALTDEGRAALAAHLAREVTP